MKADVIHLIGYASGIAGVDVRVGKGPLVIQQSRFLNELIQQGFPLQWNAMIDAPSSPTTKPEIVGKLCQQLATTVSSLVKNQSAFTVIGGDHTCAIGTWSGVYDAINQKGELGLIWIDAHMDSHTQSTSESGRIHGMPLACLLGQGHPSLTSILNANPKIKPENLCLIGVRSYEKGEAEFLKNLNVKIIFMDEVKERGFISLLHEAVKYVSANTVGYGISLDIDGVDPVDAPGVDVPEENGIHAKDLLAGLRQIANHEKLIAMEIVEFDPSRDKNQMTEKLVVSLLEAIHKKR